MNDDLLGFLEFKGLDLGSGTRDVDLKKNFKTAKDLGEEYGYDIALPSLGGLTVNQFANQNRESMIPEGKEVIKYKGKNVLVDKDRPKGVAGFRAGLADFFNLKDFYAGRGEQTDLDKMGGVATNKGYDPLGGLNVFDPKDLSQLKLNPSQQRLAGERYKGEMAGAGTPTDTIDDAMKSYFDYKKKSDTQSRKGRVLDSGLEFLNYTLTSPKIIDDLKNVTTFKQQQLLDSEAIKQGLAKEVQNRAVQSAAASAVKDEAMAKMYLAAVEGAKAGRFAPSATFSA
tara:strand:+ start:334 stop:1185 length:852 start_codon:yes stop_codon:yes gene_type:complete